MLGGWGWVSRGRPPPPLRPGGPSATAWHPPPPPPQAPVADPPPSALSFAACAPLHCPGRSTTPTASRRVAYTTPTRAHPSMYF